MLKTMRDPIFKEQENNTGAILYNQLLFSATSILTLIIFPPADEAVAFRLWGLLIYYCLMPKR